MRMAEENEKQLIIQESLRPSMLRPALLIIVGIFTLLGPLDAIYRRDEHLFWAACMVFLIGLLGVSVGGFSLLLEPISTSIVNRKEHHIFIARNKWNLVFGAAQRIAFEDVKNIEIIFKDNSEGIPQYKIQLILHNGERISLTAKWEQDGARCKTVRSELALWLRLKYR